MKVSVSYFVHNDLPFLRTVLPYEMRWADEICILDMASDDGTKEFCEAFLRPQDKYLRRDENTCPILGFGEARSAAAAMATGDWILTSDADILIDWHHAKLIKDILGRTTKNALSMLIANVDPPIDSNSSIERAIKSYNGNFKLGRHRVFVRNGIGIDFKGFIHEEPYLGEVNLAPESDATMLLRYHFHNWKNDPMRAYRYAWMLLRAMDNPQLQKYTNKWWYDVHVPQKRAELEERAAIYVRHLKEGKR